MASSRQRPQHRHRDSDQLSHRVVSASLRLRISASGHLRISTTPNDPTMRLVSYTAFVPPFFCASRPEPATPPIPPGAVRLPPVVGPTSISTRLSNLTFGYEASPSPSPSPCASCPVRYKCTRGHVITAHAASPACKSCPACRVPSNARAKHSLETLRAEAAARGGVCLAKEYPGARVPVLWRCAEGHVWEASWDNVRGKGSWCAICTGLKRRIGMDEMHAMAKERGGVCLSREWAGSGGKLEWMCAKGHRFSLAPNNMRRKMGGGRKASWCSICAREERKERRDLERKERCVEKKGKRQLLETKA